MSSRMMVLKEAADCYLETETLSRKVSKYSVATCSLKKAREY